MSMPSSRLLVATTQGAGRAFSSSSTSARCSLETEPWWARASIGGGAARLAPTGPSPAAGGRRRRRRSALGPCLAFGAISLSRAVSRSASRREFAKTIVERCCSTRSTTRSSTCGQIERPRRPRPVDAGPVEVARLDGARASLMSSTGTTTVQLEPLLGAGAARPRPARRRRGTGRPPRSAAPSRTGRCAGRVARSRASSRSSDSARWAPRLVPATACTSSTITVWTPRSVSRACAVEHQEQRLRGRDQDVRRAG